MTENASSENLRKFLESDDPAMRMMGLSMAKGGGVPEELLPTILGFYMWDDDITIRAAAKSVFNKHASKELKKKVKECWKAKYRNFPTHKEVPTENCSCKPFISSTYEFEDVIYDRDDDILCCSVFQKTIRPFMFAFKSQDNFSFIALKPLIKALGENDVLAAKALGNIGSGGAVEPLIKALGCPDTPRLKNWNIRSSAAGALGKIGDKRAVEPLIKALGDQTRRVSNSAETALGKIGDYAVEPLIKALGDDNGDVRRRAIKILGKIGDKRAVEPLIKALGDDNGNARKSAASALGEIGDKRAVEPLIKALEDEDDNDWYADYVRQNATIALGNIGDKSIIPILQKLLDDEEPNIRWDAAIALAKLDDGSGFQIIVHLLDRSYFDHFTEVNEEEEVQAILVAIQISSQYPSEQFVTNLMKLATLDRNMQIRDLAIKTLDTVYNRNI